MVHSMANCNVWIKVTHIRCVDNQISDFYPDGISVINIKLFQQKANAVWKKSFEF